MRTLILKIALRLWARNLIPVQVVRWIAGVKEKDLL